MESVIYNGTTIYYDVVKKRIKNLYARMDVNGNIKVSAPYLTSRRTIEKFVVESYFKLEKKIRNRNKNKREFDFDGKVKILGISYNKEDISDMNYFLTYKLKEYVKNNYVEICTRMGINNIPTLRFKRVKGYLGQYNKKENLINLNILIAHLDPDCVNYVIVHELCHIKYMNHQREFWIEVSKHLPNYTKVRSKCRKEFVYYENY